MPKLLSAVLAATLLVALLPASPSAAATAPWEQVVDITFPADPRVHFSDSYTACRSGCARIHQATDLMGDRMWKLYAAVDGVVCRIDDGAEDSYGRHLTVCGDDGRRYRYLHLNNDTPGTDDGVASLEHVYAPGIRHGVRVARGQHVAYLGDSGNAEGTAPHLHFDIYDDAVVNPYGESRVNPYPSLLSALARGDVPDGTAFYAEPADRVAGDDRIATALELAGTRFDAVSTVVLAPSTTPGEAIVAGPLGAALGAPVLVTAPEVLDPRVAEHIRTLGVTELILVGALLDSEGALAGVDLDAVTVTRLGSADLFQTAADVAEHVWELHGAGEPLHGTIEGELAHDHPHDLPEPAPALHVTANADRSDAVLLDGATLAGDVAIVLDEPDPTAVDQVAFHLDDDPEPVNVERRAPYDLAGGVDGAANLLPSSSLGQGAHAIVALVTYRDGRVVEVPATFTVTTAGAVTGDPLPPTSADARLEVSAEPDRSESYLLDGARVSRTVHVHLTGPDPHDVTRVRWWIDDPDRAGEPVNQESSWPYDLLGTAGGVARGLDTTQLGNGEHTVTATVTFEDGSVEAVTARFGVRNVVARRAILALGQADDPTRAWPDSLMAGYYGSLLDRPVLLTRGQDLPAPTAAALAGVADVDIIGGPAAVSEAVEVAVDGVAGTVDRLWGADRYGTAVAVVDDLLARDLIDTGRTWLTTGRNWPDAATAGPIVAAHGEALMLVDGAALGGDTASRAWLSQRANAIDGGRAIGGPVAVTEPALTSLRLTIT